MLRRKVDVLTVKALDTPVDCWSSAEASFSRFCLFIIAACINMCGFIAHKHKLLLVLNRRFRAPSPASQASFYHVTGAHLSPKESNANRAVMRRLRGSNASSVQQEPVGGRDGGSAQRRVFKSEVPLLQKQRRGGDCRVSPELRKLCMEDFPAERDRKQKAAPEAEAGPCEVVFGVAPCSLALAQGRRRVRKLFVKDGEASHRASVLQVCEEAHRQGVRVQRVSRKELDKMSSGGVHQGVCLLASPLSYLTEASAPSRAGAPLWLVLERIQDPMNLGAILRSAYFLGVDGVASSVRYSCPLSPVVSKASSGIMEVMGVYGYDNLEQMLKLRVAQGWQVVGTVGQEARGSQISITECSDFEMSKPTLLLMGGEGDGLSKELLSMCQTLLTIPAGRELVPGIESLNVSVAAGILLHSVLRSRRSTVGPPQV